MRRSIVVFAHVEMPRGYGCHGHVVSDFLFSIVGKSISEIPYYILYGLFPGKRRTLCIFMTGNSALAFTANL